MSASAPVDRSTKVMLLRQLYLSLMEDRCFAKALEMARQMVELDVMQDVARQDAARACLGLGDVEGAVQQLRLASRASPPARRAFHLWTLGSVLYLNGRAEAAIPVLARAVRWGTRDKPLYRAQLALAERQCAQSTPDLRELYIKLLDVPCGRGYGRFVLGELAYHLGEYDACRECLEEFVERTTSGRVALAVALDGELRRARELLLRLDTMGTDPPPRCP
ncbi:MAG: tetratricopeptide repeat protein [Polyangiaceae bacterium]|nr:tetratricopeptide repeat protein [Polyangiaceae bacterium]